MIRIMRSTRTLGALAVLAISLAACGSENQPKSIGDQLFQATKGTFARKPATDGNQAAMGLTRAQIETSQQPFIRLKLLTNGTVATAASIAQNQGTQSYFMGTGQAVYLKDGLLTGTRGLGSDLMSLGTSAPSLRAELAAGSSTRTYRFLDAEGQIFALNVRCTSTKGATTRITQSERSYTVIPVDQTCSGDGTAFTNRYYMAPKSGTVWQSSQWVSPVMGMLRIEQLKL